MYLTLYEITKIPPFDILCHDQFSTLYESRILGRLSIVRYFLIVALAGPLPVQPTGTNV